MLPSFSLTVLWLGTAIHTGFNLMGGSSISHPQIPDAPLLGIIPQKIGDDERCGEDWLGTRLPFKE